MIRDYQVDEWAAPVIEDAEIVPDGRLNWFDAKSSRQPSDEALLTALADGAAWALEALYQRYSRSLYSLAYCRLPINRSLKICCKMHSWLCGDAPPLILRKQAQFEAGFSPYCVIERSTIYAESALNQLYRKYR